MFENQEKNQCRWLMVKGVETDISIVNVHDLLSYVLINERYRDLVFSKQLHLKLSGDGRMSSKKSPFLLVTVTIMMKGHYYDTDDVYTVALMDYSESREATEILFDLLNPS